MSLVEFSVSLFLVLGQTLAEDGDQGEVTRLRDAAQSDFAAGNTRDALAAATRLLTLGGDQPADRLLLARISMAEADRQADEALSHSQVTALLADADVSAGFAAKDPVLRDAALSVQAFARYKRGDTAGAMSSLDKVLLSSPNDLDALALRGFLRTITGRADLAITDLDHAIQLAPDRLELRVHRARALAADNPEAAAAEFHKIVESGLVDSRLPADVYEILATRRKIAAAVLEPIAAALGEEEPLGWYWLGRALNDSSQANAAVAAFDRALAAAPGNTTITAFRADARGNANDIPGMITDLIAVVTGDDSAEKAWAVERLANTAAWLAGQRRWGEVVLACTALIADDSSEPALHANLAIALHRSGRSADAERVYREALQRFPDDAGLHNDYGLVLEAGGFDVDAAARFSAAADRGSADGLENLAILRLDEGDVAGAEPPLTQLLTRDPLRLRAIAALDRVWAARRGDSR